MLSPFRSIYQDLTKMGRLGAKQIQDALRAFEKFDIQESELIIERDDVFDGLNLSIEEQVYSLLINNAVTDKDLRFLRSATKVSTNLERIGDAACHIANRVKIAHLENANQIQFDLGEMEPISLAAIHDSIDSYLDENIELAQNACLREPQLDAVFRLKINELQQIMSFEPHNIRSLLNWYSVAKYLEKVCDYTLNIGEQAIYLITGRRLKFHQYQQMDRLIHQYQNSDTKFYPYYDGISGATVARVENGKELVVIKQGSKKKIKAEADKLKIWQDIAPDLTPRLITTDSGGNSEVLLREFVNGTLLSDILFNPEKVRIQETAINRLIEVLYGLWELTLKKVVPQVNYIEQIRTRLGEVYAMHPYLEYAAVQEELEKIMAAIARKEASLSPGFSVWLHGDLNVNNVFYNDGKIKFIDVHRSNYGDYMSDLGVFFVSITRQPDINPELYQQLEDIRKLIKQSLAVFAGKHSDAQYKTRFKLSIARSYLTSSRLIGDKNHAGMLFNKGLHLLKEVAEL